MAINPHVTSDVQAKNLQARRSFHVDMLLQLREEALTETNSNLLFVSNVKEPYFIQERLYSAESQLGKIVSWTSQLAPTLSRTRTQEDTVTMSFLAKEKQNATSYSSAWRLERAETSSMQTYHPNFWKEK